MPATVWKGHLTFGLVSIPVRLFRAARRERISFRQLYRPVGQADSLPSDSQEAEAEQEPASYQPAAQPEPGRIVKGYEFEKGHYVAFEKEELEKIAPKTTTGMEIFEFVKFAEIDPIYLDSSYYVAPEEAGEKPYALLFDTMRESGYVALAEFAMRRRQHAVVIRPGHTGIIAHTLYYADEIRKADESRAETMQVTKKERDLALTLIQSMAAKFEPEKLKDAYREKLKELIAAKVAGREATVEAPAKAAPVVDIMKALEQSLAMRRKPVASETAPARKVKRKSQR